MVLRLYLQDQSHFSFQNFLNDPDKLLFPEFPQMNLYGARETAAETAGCGSFFLRAMDTVFRDSRLFSTYGVFEIL